MKSLSIRRFASKRVLGAALAVVAAGGLLLGATDVSAAELHPSRIRDRVACIRLHVGGDRLGSALTDLVSDGTLTSDQKDAIVAKLAENLTAGERVCTGIGLARDGTVGEAITDLLGMDRTEIREAWLDDQSLTEMAAAQGIDRQTLVDTITNAVSERLDKAVEKGRITEDEKTNILDAVTPIIERAVDTHHSEVQDRLDGGATPEAESTPVGSSADALLA